MSLIEAAVEKAKSRAESSAKPPLNVPAEPESPTPRSRMAQPDAAAVAGREAMARVLPIASVDASVMERHGVLLQVDDSAAQRSYRILRTRVQQRMQAEGWFSVAMIAAGVGEGKTLTAINLAITLARDVNTWVYLVDLDLQRPKIATYLGMRFEIGLSDYLAGTAQFEDVLYSPGVARLGVIPNAQPIENSSEAMGSPRIRELCRSLAAEKPRPIIVYDMPPLLMGDDVLKFHPNVDSALFVVSEGQTSRATVKRANEILQEMNLLGVVINRSAEREESGYY